MKKESHEYISKMTTSIDGISLNEFITLAISEIAKGIDEAIEKSTNVQILINPIIGKDGFVSTNRKGDKRSIQLLEFDLSVSASSTTASSGGGGIRVTGLFSAEGKAEKAVNELTVSRLKFSIPVCFSTNTDGERSRILIDPSIHTGC